MHDRARLTGVFVLAVAASAIVGGLACYAVSFLPDWDDAAGRGLGQAFRALLTAVYVVLSLVFFGVAMWRSDRKRHVKRALYVLLLMPWLIALLGLIDNGVHNFDWLREAVGMVQIFTPLWIVATVQWLILRRYASRRVVDANQPQGRAT